MDVSVYLPTILAISGIILVIPRKKIASIEPLYYFIAIILGLVDIALGGYTYEALKKAGLYNPLIPISLIVIGLTLTHKLYSYKYAPSFLAFVSGLIAAVIVYVYFAVTNEIILVAVALVVMGFVYSVVSVVFGILDAITRFLDLYPFRLLIALRSVILAVSLAAGISLPVRDFSSRSIHIVASIKIARIRGVYLCRASMISSR